MVKILILQIKIYNSKHLNFRINKIKINLNFKEIINKIILRIKFKVYKRRIQKSL
jgi:hypothetical protein